MNESESNLPVPEQDENRVSEIGSEGETSLAAPADQAPAPTSDAALDITMGDMETDLPSLAGTGPMPQPLEPEAEAESDTPRAEMQEAAAPAPEPETASEMPAPAAEVEAEPELPAPAAEPETQPVAEAEEVALAETDLPVAETRAPAEEMEIPWGEMDLTGGASEEEEAVLATTEAEATPGEVTAQAPAPAEGPLPIRRVWYVVHCYSGYENKVKKGLEQRINSMGLQDYIFRVVVPVEREVEIREGQRKNIERRVFPGYILVEMMELVDRDQAPDEPTQAWLNLANKSDEVWYAVRNTPGVTGFVSSGDKQRPVPLREEEVNKILKRMESEEPKVHVTFRVGQSVHIIDGPFADFRGNVDAVDMTKGKVRVLVSFFGRETPVELDLLQVEKV